jgi:xanthosine utilization system XapX-like protein
VKSDALMASNVFASPSGESSRLPHALNISAPDNADGGASTSTRAKGEDAKVVRCDSNTLVVGYADGMDGKRNRRRGRFIILGAMPAMLASRTAMLASTYRSFKVCCKLIQRSRDLARTCATSVQGCAAHACGQFRSRNHYKTCAVDDEDERPRWLPWVLLLALILGVALGMYFIITNLRSPSPAVPSARSGSQLFNVNDGKVKDIAECADLIGRLRTTAIESFLGQSPSLRPQNSLWAPSASLGDMQAAAEVKRSSLSVPDTGLLGTAVRLNTVLATQQQPTKMGKESFASTSTGRELSTMACSWFSVLC